MIAKEARDEIARLLAESEAMRKALEAIQKANDDFIAGLPADWEGDPLQDAISEALALIGQKDS